MEEGQSTIEEGSPSPLVSSGRTTQQSDAIVEEDCDETVKDDDVVPPDALPPSAELIAFDVVALSWMVQTEGNLGQKGKQMEEMEESIKVLRMRLDKVVTDFSRHFKTAGKVTQNNLELLSDSQVAKRQFQDKEKDQERKEPPPVLFAKDTAASRLGKYFGSGGAFTGALSSGPEDDDQISQAETDAFDMASVYSTMESRRASAGDWSPSAKPSRRQSFAPSTPGVSTGTPLPLTAVTRGEFTEMQQSVGVLENSHQTLVADVNKLLLAQERRMDEVEKAASAHFKELRDFIEIATNTATEGMEATKRASALAAASMQAAADRSEALLIQTRQVEEPPATVEAVATNPEESPAVPIGGVEDGPEAQTTSNATKSQEDGKTSRPNSASSPHSPREKGPRLSDISSVNDPEEERERRSVKRTKSKISSEAPAFEAINALRDRMQTVETSVTGLVSDVASLRQQVMKRMSAKRDLQAASSPVNSGDSPQLAADTASPPQKQQQQQSPTHVQHESSAPRLNTVICGDMFGVPSPPPSPIKDLSKALTARSKLNAKRRPASPLSLSIGGPPPPARPGTPAAHRKSGARGRTISQTSNQSCALMMRSASPDSQEADLGLAVHVTSANS